MKPGGALLIDLRSDTVTRPSEAMRKVMAAAEVGDDVYGEDPTIRRLEEASAALTGKEAGLFVASGTMGNLVATLTHLRPGEELFAEAEAHILYYEQGGCSRLAGAMPHPIPGVGGVIKAETLRGHIRPADLHFPRPGLLALENTHNRSGGEAIRVEEQAALLAVAREAGLRSHLDGARIVNAAVALGVRVSDVAEGFDSVTFCLSKGLGAPVGSVVTGERAFIDEARRSRKVVGGGLRQAGVLAACGLFALDGFEDRIALDHEKARLLAARLSEVAGLTVRPARIRTNMVLVDVEGDASAWVRTLKAQGVLVNATGPATIRLVTHQDVDLREVPIAVDAFRKTAKAIAA